MDRVTEALDWVVDKNSDYPVMIEIDKDDAKSHRAELATLRAENERLREALREVTQTLSWQCFGECRGISDNLLEARDAVALAKEAMK